MNRLVIICAAVISLASSHALSQGPLIPPGAPAPTMKTLDQLDAKLEKRTPISSLPFTISQSGSYYLTANLTGSQGNNGITINGGVNNVTLDLNGFNLSGPSNALYGVASGVVTSLIIRNGTVSGWGLDGISCGSASDTLIERINAVGNGSSGPLAGSGIVAGANSVVWNCTADTNASYGIQVGSNSTITNCSVQHGGSAAISAGADSTIKDCSASLTFRISFTTIGIQTANGCVISGCTANNNGGPGIQTGNDSNISGCVASYNTGDGIVAGVVAKISHCVSGSNGGRGIAPSSHALVEHCHVNANGSNGIQVSNFSLVKDCTVDYQQAGAGINVTSFSNRIEANNVTRNAQGINVISAENLIIRNSASGNTTNYVITAGNRYGPIIDDTAGGTAAVNGNSAADTTQSTHPWANFSY